MPSFYGENPPDTEVGSTDATESQISEDAVTETDTSGGFYQGSPEQTTTEAYEADARTARDAALAAQEAAEDAQAAAEASESAASSSESNAASSQSAAATSATNASNSASAAAGSATTAATQASNAASSATAAASSASAAASSESAAASSQSAAASSQTAAAGSATAAASSAGTASTKASEAATSATNAAASESAAASSESNASTSASQAATSATNAAASESAAASSETNAASSASAASTSASNAASSASAASSSATAAASSASSASTSATAAGSARDAALAALDSFDDRYLGQKSSDPSLDNDGNALVAGALYFDTVNTVMKVYDGSQWLAAYASVSGALLAINNLDDVSNTATARSNLGLGTAAEQNVGYFATAAQGSLADSALQNGDNVSVLTNDSGYLTGNETITLTGDVSGSGTTSISVTIADDSHNHVISNVDGLQAALDAKQDASTALTTSNYSTTLDGRYYTETEVGTFFSGSSAITGYNKTNWDTAYGWGNHASVGYLTGNQTITLTGDVSGSGTTSIAVTIADDSHNHVISNVDGLQTALNAKQDASTALTTSTTFGGDVSGTYNAIVVADDSHTHDGRYYTESEADSRFVNVTGDTMTGNMQITGNLDVDGIIDNTRNNGNVSAPSTSDHTAGTRIKFYDSSATAFYAMGIENDSLWFNSDTNYKWYVDAALKVDFDSSGVVNAVGGYKVGGTEVINSSRNIYANNYYFANGLVVAQATDSYLRINQSNQFGSGTWFGSSNIMSGTAYIATGSNGGSTTSRVYLYGGTYNGTNVIALDGSDGKIKGSYYQVGNTTVIDSNRRNIYLDSSTGGDGNGIFFRDGFTYNCSITVEDHNGNFADGLHISAYDGVSIGTGANTKSTDLLVDVSGNTTVYGNLNSVGGYKVNGTTIVDSARTVSNVDLYALRTDTVAPYISPTNPNTLNAGLNWNSDAADLWINYRGYQDGTTQYRDFRIGDGKNVGLLHVDGSAATVNIGYDGRAVDLNLVSGSYSAGGSVVIDTSRSLLNLSGTIRSDSTFSFLTSTGSAQYGKFYGVSVSNTYTIGSYGGYFNAQNGYMVGNTTIVDSSRNLQNIGGGAYTAQIGSAGFSWGGVSSYPTIYGSSADRWVMLCFPHIPYLQNGVRGHTGSTWGAITRYEGDTSTTTYWDVGCTNTNAWSVYRNGTDQILNVNNSDKMLQANYGLYLYGRSNNWNETTPGLAVGTIHMAPANPDNYGSAITWGASDASSGTTANAGIYIRSDGSYGTKMYLATTDSYATGSKTAITIDHSGTVTLNRSHLVLDQIRLNGSGSRMIRGETKNGHNSVTVTGNWDEFNIMGRVLDWTSNNLHFGDGYNGVNHGSHYFQIGTGTGKISYMRVGGDFYADGNVIAYYSDARLKQAVETIPNALDIIKGIRGVYFEWNKKSEEVWAKKEGEKDFGLISQEVEAVFPMGVAVQCGADKAKEMGYGDPDSPNYDPLHTCDNEEEQYKTVKYDKMVAVAIQAINEQQEIIERQQSQIDELKTLITQLMEK